MVVLAKWLAAVGGLLLVIAVFRQDPAPPAPESTDTVAVRHVAPMKASRPVSLTIPALALDASIEQLGVDLDQHLEVPSDPEAAGWYRESLHLAPPAPP